MLSTLVLASNRVNADTSIAVSAAGGVTMGVAVVGAALIMNEKMYNLQ